MKYFSNNPTEFGLNYTSQLETLMLKDGRKDIYRALLETTCSLLDIENGNCGCNGTCLLVQEHSKELPDTKDFNSLEQYVRKREPLEEDYSEEKKD